MQIGHFIGISIALAILIIVGMQSMKKVKSAADFDTGGGKGSVWLVTGLLLGSLIGGQCTIGTAQLAYTYGLSAIWFSFGAGLGSLVLCLIFVVPLRRRRDVTLLEVIRKEFGEKAEYLGSVLCSFGILVSVVSNVVASSALIMALTNLPMWLAAIISVTLMCCYVVFGGAWGAEMGGIVKVALLLATSAVCVAVVMMKTGGPVAMGGTLEMHMSDIFSRGVGKDLSNVVSAILGVLSTQTYAQAVWSAKNYHVARKAALLGCVICLPVGFTGMMVGLAMRGSGLVNPAEAFPMFLLENLPPVLGGIGIGALLITVVTGGGGLTLGVSTIFVRDIAGRIWPKLNHGKAHINAMRITMLVVLTGCTCVALLLPGALINDLGFLSMGLRGTVVFIPLSLALFCKGRFDYKPVLISMIAGPAAMVIGNLVWSPIDPLVGSILICLFICMFGYRSKDRAHELELQEKKPFRLKSIKTERLVLNKWTLSDADIEGLYAFASNPNVGPNAGWKPHASLEESREIIEKVFLPYHVWSIRERETGRVVGNIGLEPDRRREDVNSMEVGYSLAEDCWGKGYMTEACKAVVDFAFREFGLVVIGICTGPENVRSQRVIEKCGFVFEGRQRKGYHIFDGTDRDNMVYSMTREEWEESRK